MGDDPHKTIDFGGKLSFILSFLFLNAANAATCIFTAPNCITNVLSLEPRALNGEFEHFILSCSSVPYWDLIKCLYFADTTERGDRGWKEAQRQGYFMDNSSVLKVSFRFLGWQAAIFQNVWQFQKNN
jgi:hypothetical protein